MSMQTPSSDYADIETDAMQRIIPVLARDRRVMLFGPPGTGKSTLVTQLAMHLARDNRSSWCISADPGSPAFGVPGAVSLGNWQADHWAVIAMHALCSLDAGRFRVPLLIGVQRLSKKVGEGMVFIDSPGVVRGMAGRELLYGLLEAGDVDLVLLLTHAKSAVPLEAELRACGVEILRVPANPVACRPGKKVRAKTRTRQWDTHLADAGTQELDLEKLSLLGMVPPVAHAEAWTGRQVALLSRQHTLAMGEVLQLHGQNLSVRMAGAVNQADALLIRDVVRTGDGVLETAEPWAAERLTYVPPAEVLPSVQGSTGPRLVGRVGPLDIALINGVFGDPLLHLRLRHQGRSLLFDLGSGERLSARTAHQVTDVFISHAHLDHISGFLSLLRSRIGDFPPCRLYGPPGLSGHIAGFIQGALWDRVALHGPQFEVMEFDGARMQCFRLQATQPVPQLFAEHVVEEGVICCEADFLIRAVVLDHQGTSVVAYAFEPNRVINVRKDRLRAHGWNPGPWLNALKQHVLRGETNVMIPLPDGSKASTAILAQELLLITPAKRLVYATDLADTPANRQRVIKLAQHAHTFFCESPFLEAEAEHALRNGHLTTRGCGEIANAAGVTRLVPFHFSRRYQDTPQLVYDELSAICPSVVIPAFAHVFQAPASLQEETALD